MELQIRNSKLVISNQKKSFGTELVIKRFKNLKSKAETKLSEVIQALPNGFIYKEETGIGATTSEIKAERHSIIVEPIKITASSKAAANGCLYVGSSTMFHPRKTTTKKDIQDYLSDPNTKYKKIIVVADSLKKVIGAIGPKVFSDFFLLIDEIDSFQLDSLYRKSMEECLEIYKQFTAENRAMLSATRIDFSDNELSKEPITYIKYDIPTVRELKVITTYTNSLLATSIDLIIDIIKSFPNDKVFIAYNAVNGCYNLAQHLVDHNIVKQDQVSILCSGSSKDAAKFYYQELNSVNLPTRVNFFTSAYFTGFDLEEQYHLVSISGNKSRVHALSDRRLKQIAGRSRVPNGILSETIIHDNASKDKLDERTKDEMIVDGQRQVDALNCMKKTFALSPVLALMTEDVNDSVLKALDEKDYRMVRKDKSGKFTLSFLNIDARLEGIRVRNQLYINHDSLYKKLKKDGHKVTHQKIFSNTVVNETKVSQIDRKEKVKEVIDKLKKVTTDMEIKEMIKRDGLNPLQMKIANDYKKYLGYVHPDSTLSFLEESIINSRDLRKYNNVLLSITLLTQPKTSLMVQRLDNYFPIGNKFTSNEIHYRMGLYLHEIQSTIRITSPVNAARLLNILRSTYRKADSKKVVYYHIKNDNPFNLQILKKKKPIEEIGMLAAFLQLV